MRIVLSGLIQDARGSLGGSVMGVWKGIHYLRQKPAIVSNPQSLTQNSRRAEFLTSASGWKLLTEEEKALWEEYAQKLRSSPYNDEDVGSDGIIPSPGRIQSGMNVYIAVNQILISCGLPRVKIPPLYHSKPPTIRTNLSQYGTYSGGVIDFEVWLPYAYTPAPCYAQIWMMGWWKGSNSFVAVVPAPDVHPLPLLPTPISIDKIRISGMNSVNDVPLSTIAPCEVFIQMRTVAKNGVFSSPSALYRVKVVV